MQNPAFAVKEYLNAASLNAAVGAVSGNLGLLGAATAKPGLISPEVMTIGVTGLATSVTLPVPFGVLFTGGVLVQAHGNQTNADTQTYAVNFSGAVPVTGSVTAYLLASLAATIGQQPYQVIGPPPGNPDYNPSFQPYTAYAVNVDTLTVAISTTPPDGLTTFELARATLAAGATGVALSTVYQQRLSAPNTIQSQQVTGSTQLLISQAGTTQYFTASGTATLPAASGSNGLVYGFAAGVAGATVATTAPDLIYGAGTASSVGVNNVSVPNGAALVLECIEGIWQTIGKSSAGNLYNIIVQSSGFVIGAAQTGNVYELSASGGASGTINTAGMQSGWNAKFFVPGASAGTWKISASGALLDGVPARQGMAGTKVEIIFDGTGLQTNQGSYAFNSGQQTWSNGGVVGPFPHGLGTLPDPTTIAVTAVNLSAEGGYSPGQTIGLTNFSYSGGAGGGSAENGDTIYYDATNISIAISFSGLNAVVAGGSTAFGMTAAKWALVISCKAS